MLFTVESWPRTSFRPTVRARVARDKYFTSYFHYARAVTWNSRNISLYDIQRRFITDRRARSDGRSLIIALRHLRNGIIVYYRASRRAWRKFTTLRFEPPLCRLSRIDASTCRALYFDIIVRNVDYALYRAVNGDHCTARAYSRPLDHLYGTSASRAIQPSISNARFIISREEA